MQKFTYAARAHDIGALLDQKLDPRPATAEEVGEVLVKLYREGIPKERVGDLENVTAVVRALFTIARRQTTLGPSPWESIAEAGIMGVVRDESARGRAERELIREDVEREAGKREKAGAAKS